MRPSSNWVNRLPAPRLSPVFIFMLRKTAVFLSFLSLITIIIIASGWVDPHPVGVLAWEQTLFPITAPAHGGRVVWLDEGVNEPFSVRLTAVFTNGNHDSRYGLLLGDKANPLSITISPTGYAAVDLGETAVMPYAPFPHVRRDGVNEIWVDVDGEAVIVRLNRELFWQGEAVVDGGLGLKVENFGDGDFALQTAVVDFQTLSFFAP